MNGAACGTHPLHLRKRRRHDSSSSDSESDTEERRRGKAERAVRCVVKESRFRAFSPSIGSSSRRGSSRSG